MTEVTGEKEATPGLGPAPWPPPSFFSSVRGESPYELLGVPETNAEEAAQKKEFESQLPGLAAGRRTQQRG